MQNEFKPYDLSVMNLQKRFVFIADETPFLSWKTFAKTDGFVQTAYQIKAASTKNLLEGNQPDLWDSGKIESEQSLYIPWGATPLASRSTVFWNVTVWDQKGNPSLTSDTASFEVALKKNTDWKAQWIHFNTNSPAKSSPSPYFRKEFYCKKTITKARLYISARGVFEAYINGQRVGNDFLVPGWTDFNQQIQYMSYDVTSLLNSNANNAIGACVAPGWYCGYLAWKGENNLYGKYQELLAQVEITYEDHSTETIVTDSSWKSISSPITADIYNGETYDEYAEKPGWNLPDYDDSEWFTSLTGELAATTKQPLVAKVCAPVRKIMELKPVKLLHPQKDTTIWDFGQNISGWVKIGLKTNTVIKFILKFGEMLYPDGSLYNLNYRSAESTDRFMFKRDKPEKELYEYEPHFTFHGFRYCQIDGFQRSGVKPEELEVTAVVLHSDLQVTGTFECGLPKINQLYSNVCWGQRGNFLEIPTDCPQRDERLGWTGDAEVFCATAAFNMNVSAFFRKWLRDQREAQFECGAGAHVCPNILGNGTVNATGEYTPWGAGGSAAWADSIVITPWVMYQCYGDLQCLRDNFDSMKRWIDYMKKESNNLIRPEYGYGDWLALDPVVTPKAYIGTAYFAYTSALVSKIATLLGYAADATTYGQLSQQVAEAFRKEYVGADGMLKIQNQTTCILALYFDLLLPEQRNAHIQLLNKLIQDNGNKISTGFVGTASIMLILTQVGLTETAYNLLLQEEFPSWLFSVNQGATTIWERWNSYTIKDGFGPVNMNSFNHYAYGAVAQWMAATVGGISYNLPGGKEIKFAAIPDVRLGNAKASLDTPYGKATSEWEFDGKRFHWQVSSPANTTAQIINPFPNAKSFSINGITSKEPFQKVQSGTYTIDVVL